MPHPTDNTTAKPIVPKDDVVVVDHTATTPQPTELDTTFTGSTQPGDDPLKTNCEHPQTGCQHKEQKESLPEKLLHKVTGHGKKDDEDKTTKD